MFYEREVKHIPVNLSQTFPNLVAISLPGCSISSIGDHFKGLSDVVILSLSSNQIDTVAIDAFKDNAHLEYLELDTNKLKYISNELFQPLHNIKGLFLQKNQIEVIESSAFKNLINLEELQLYFNKISSIDAKTFQNLKKLKSLYLQHNQIVAVETGAFDGLMV